MSTYSLEAKHILQCVFCFRTVKTVQEVTMVKKGGVISFRVQPLAVRAFLLGFIVLLSIHTLSCAKNLSVPVLLVHGFQIGAINPLALSAGQFDLRNTWKTMVGGLVGERHCTFVPIPVTDSRGQRLWTFWKARNHPIYISNYTENVKIPSLTCIGAYAALLANEIQVVKRREGVDKIDIVCHSMGGLVSRAYIERSDFREGDGALLYYDYTYGQDVRKLIMLGTPNHGSPLMEIAEVLGVSRKETPPFSVRQMHPRSKFLRLLNGGRSGRSFGVEYSAIAGNKCPCGLWDKFWAKVCSQIGIEIPPHAYCSLFEEYHGCGDNDLVVATESVKLSEIPPQRYIVYPLDHDRLYRDAEVIRKVRTLLL